MSALALTQSFAVHPDGISADTIDGEVIIVNLKNGIYYSLTALGAEIWSLLQEQATLAEIVERLLARHAGDRTGIRDWVLTFVGELEAEALIVRADVTSARVFDPSALTPIAASAMSIVTAPVLMKYTDLRQIVLLSSANLDDLRRVG
jgi:hypothetical protein